jgi:hypothetical protein
LKEERDILEPIPIGTCYGILWAVLLCHRREYREHGSRTSPP